MDALIQQLKQWIASTDRNVTIGITGHGAAGKSTFANQLIASFDDMKVNYLNTDTYIITQSIRKFTTIEYEYDGVMHSSTMTASHPAAHNISALERDITMIRANMPLLTIDAHYDRSKLLPSNHKVTIVEGMSVAFVKRELFDLSIYMYCDAETEFSRRLDRDIGTRGADLNRLLQTQQQRRIQYELFHAPTRHHCDWIINNSNSGIVIDKHSS